ncbi:MAG: hypothetical protein DHS20C19_03800 [Acidimicrobiales bacterium]|nr:MAG: hypothetical protein DHS20C19_03800 [Acidimicrobiales bacterium]
MYPLRVMATRRERWIGIEDTPQRQEFWAQWRTRQPGFREAVLADARMAARNRGEIDEVDGVIDAIVLVVRLCFTADAFLGHVLYRARVALRVRRVPVVPRLLHLLAISRAQICIGDPVEMAPGVYLPHGQVVIDGITVIESRVVIAPFTTLGLKAGAFRGPTVREGARIGTGARVLGDTEIGSGAEVGANAVVTRDVEPGTVVVGIPARVIGSGTA